MRRAAVILALALVPVHSFAADHYCFGLMPATEYVATANSQFVFEGPSSSVGSIRFSSTERGQFVVAPGDTVQIPACADLQCRDQEWRPLPVGCTQPPDIRLQIWNSGLGAAPASQCSIRIDGNVVATVAVQALAPGEMAWTAWVTVTRPPPGQHIVTGCADSGNVVQETDETNNCSGR